jgi:hypothetical protein
MPDADGSSAVARWRRGMGKVKLRLLFAQCLNWKPGDERKFCRHRDYLQKLRVGTHARAQLGVLHTEARVSRIVSDAMSLQHQVAAESQQHLDKLAYWQQGDLALSSAENARRRMALRRSDPVQEVLDAFWNAEIKGGHCKDSGMLYLLSRSGYDALYLRIHRALIDDFDQDDAAETIAEDWEKDSKGELELSREAFYDSLFELADMW